MSSERAIESTGESVEQAIANGLVELGGVSPSDVIVEVLEEPSRGVFGLGARPAKVRLKLFRTQVVATPPPSTLPIQTVPTPQATATPHATSKTEDTYVDSDDEDEMPLLDEMQEITDEKAIDQDALVGKTVLELLLEKMAIHNPKIVVRHAENSENGDASPWLLDITGPDLTPLVGRRGETLAALQYITRLIASRELQHRANIVVDAAGYKSRRSRMLHDLAIRMADQAIRSRRVVTLEPMPPYERRIIHLALRNRDDVQTKSVGEGNSRKVTIVPK
jgi:spoIIIJ-associated protein